MHVLIRYFDGRLADGILLRASGNVLRVAMPALDDGVEFTLHAGYWVSDTCEPVEIEFFGGSAEQEWHTLCDELSALDEMRRSGVQALLDDCVPPTPSSRSWAN